MTTQNTSLQFRIADVPEGWLFAITDSLVRRDQRYYRKGDGLAEYCEFGRPWSFEDCGLTADSVVTITGKLSSNAAALPEAAMPLAA